MIRWTLWAGTAALLAALAGCYESTDITVHSPGVYKGAHDPLLDRPVAERSAALKKRFQLVQVER